MNSMSVVARMACVMSIFASYPVKADIGQLTINGVEIPANFYNGMYKGKNWCPPTSDARYRDTLINKALIVFAGREGNFKLTTSEQQRIAEKTNELKRAEVSGNADTIDEAAWSLFHVEGNVYGSYLYPSVSEMFNRQDVLNEYKRLIEIKDPRLTDVVTAKHVQMTFPDRERAQIAVDLLNSGKSLSEVASAIDEFEMFPHNMGTWFIVDEIRGFSSDSRQLRSGMAVFASEGNMWFSAEEQFVLYFDEVLKLSRLRPFTEYNNRDNYAYDIAQYNLWSGVHDARRIERWANADIREDGEPVEMLEEYPECP